MHVRPRALACLSFASLLLVSGCGFTGEDTTGNGSGQASDTDQRIVVDNFRAPTADWALASDAAYILSLSGCLETLTRFDQEEGEVVPFLATDWEQVSDLEWDFTLREGVVFQDGEPLTTEAVAAALEHVLGATVPARAFNPSVISGVSVLDERTIRISTPTASPLVPYRLASVNTGILSPAAYEGDSVDPFGHCTGPFTPVSERPKQSLTLDRNEDYWDGEVQLAGAEIRFITDGATRATQVQTGEADISLSIPVSQVAALEAGDDVEVLTADSPRTATLYLNNSRAPLDDVDVRKAIRSALDLDALAGSVYEGTAVASTGPFAPSEPWTTTGGTQPQQDLDEARRLLDAAGYTAERPLEIIAIVERAEFTDVATVIQEDLQKIDLPVSIQVKEYAAAEPDVLAGNYDMLLSQRNRLIDIADPIGFLTSDYSCDGSYNLSQFCDPDFDALLTEAGTTTDTEERNRLYSEAGQILTDSAVNVWLVNEQAVDAVRTDVQSYRQDPLSRYVLSADTSISGS